MNQAQEWAVTGAIALSFIGGAICGAVMYRAWVKTSRFLEWLDGAQDRRKR